MAFQTPLIPDPQKGSSTNPPAAVIGLTGADLDRRSRSLDGSVSDNPRSMYNSSWRAFEAWAHARGTLSLPASPPLVAAYLSHLVEERCLSVATVRLHKAALAAIHKAAGHADPTDHKGVRQIMKGIARAHGRPQKQARPLTAEALAAARATARGRRPLGDGKRQESVERASWRGRMDVALLSILRDRLLRRSEAAALAWADIEFRDNGSALITVRRSKTDQEAEGLPLCIGREAAQALQAIRPAQELLGPERPGLRAEHPPHRKQGEGRSKGRRPGRLLHQPQRPRGHGPGPGKGGSGAAGPDDRRPMEVFQDASQVHRAPSRRPGRGGQVLPGGRQLRQP